MEGSPISSGKKVLAARAPNAPTRLRKRKNHSQGTPWDDTRALSSTRWKVSTNSVRSERGLISLLSDDDRIIDQIVETVFK